MLLNSNRTVEKQAEKRSGRACRRLDYQTEEIVRLALRVVGFRMIGRTRPLDGGPVEETGGDFRAVEPGTGRSVLVAVKCRSGRLRWSDLRPHQRQALDEHHRLGGISILAWVTERHGIWLLRWPVEGFGPGRSLQEETAEPSPLNNSQTP